jgi:hypothetical protein
VNSLIKTCSPSFDESFLSGGDQINMRWEYCTKMTFSANGFAEWHSWSTYKSKNYFEKLFQNYLLENKIYKEDYLDINKHLIQIDLAIYD